MPNGSTNVFFCWGGGRDIKEAKWVSEGQTKWLKMANFGIFFPSDWRNGGRGRVHEMGDGEEQMPLLDQ